MYSLSKARYVVALLSILVLGGCASTITKYDSTFTSAVSTHGSSGLSVKPVSKRKKPYFIEFRARNALTYGHASVVFGKLDTNGNIPVNKSGVLIPGMVEISGLHPATTSNIPWTVGHVVPIPAETGPSDGDFEDAYVTARYRIDLTEAEFRRVVRIVSKHKNSNPMWYAPIYAANCLGYIGSIAKDMGLRVPIVPDFPKEYVEKLKSLNT